MNAATTVTATFNQGTAYSLMVTKSGAAAFTGYVITDFGGINCGNTCTRTIVSGTNVTLTASMASGSFTGWGGVCSGTNPICTLTMDAPKSVTASFDWSILTTYLLTVTKTGTGTLTSNFGGINCGSACSGTYVAGNTVTLTTNPASGSTFVGWSGGGCSGNSPSCTVTMDQAKTVTASFTGGGGPTSYPLRDSPAEPWRDLNLWGGLIPALAIDPVTPSTVYAGTNPTSNGDWRI